MCESQTSHHAFELPGAASRAGHDQRRLRVRRLFLRRAGRQLVLYRRDDARRIRRDRRLPRRDLPPHQKGHDRRGAQDDPAGRGLSGAGARRVPLGQRLSEFCHRPGLSRALSGYFRSGHQYDARSARQARRKRAWSDRSRHLRHVYRHRQRLCRGALCCRDRRRLSGRDVPPGRIRLPCGDRRDRQPHLPEPRARVPHGPGSGPG